MLSTSPFIFIRMPVDRCNDNIFLIFFIFLNYFNAFCSEFICIIIDIAIKKLLLECRKAFSIIKQFVALEHF